MKHNIESVRVYQAVKFDNKLTTFFTTQGTMSHPIVTIEILEGIGIEVSNERDCVIIPFPNIAVISKITKTKMDKREAHKKDVEKLSKPQKVSKPKSDPTLINR